VDFGTDSVSTIGVHLAGDFQMTYLGAPADFDPGATMMSNVSGTAMYEYYADLPANKKYEYYFVNGIHSYEAEFVPFECRVEYDINGSNSNRWFYLDSTSNDTTTIGGFHFSGAAPDGSKFLRFVVDYSIETPSSLLPSVKGDFNNFTSGHSLYPLFGKVYQAYTYVNAGLHEWIYTDFNGVNESNIADCANSSNYRYRNIPIDTVLPIVYFNKCDWAPLSVQNMKENEIPYLTNLITDKIILKQSVDIKIYGIAGSMIYSGTTSEIDFQSQAPGLYILDINGKRYKAQKL
jgi:hypothetical protein